jgi:Protein of unknown function (DUF1800)
LPVQLVQNEAKVRIEAAVAAEIGFVERLVWFWSNHFCVSADKILSMAGPYEREAIRCGRGVMDARAYEAQASRRMDLVRSTGSRRWLRSEIRIGFRCAATMR